MDRFLEGEVLSEREQAFHALVRSSHSHDENERRSLALDAAKVLTPQEVYHASGVISLFNFYNKFVDINGVAELSPEGYAASGKRLSEHGYAPPNTK